MRLIDSHAHLHFPAFDADVEEVLRRAHDNNIGLVTVGTKFSTSALGIAFAEAHDDVWATIGLHPGHVHDHHFVDENEEHAEAPSPEHTFDEAKYETLVTHPKCVAIGEFGLDYSRVPEGMDVETFKLDQQRVARQQLRFAAKHQKPVVIHCRGGLAHKAGATAEGATEMTATAHEDMMQLIREDFAVEKCEKRGVIHCFTGTALEAKQYADLGFFVSIPGIVTFGKSVAAAVKEIPLSQMMIETDCPYLSPIPLRGKRNEPANVALVAQAVADLKGVSIQEVAAVTSANAVRFFGLT